MIRLLVMLLLAVSSSVQGQEKDMQRGVRLLKADQPAQAVPLLERVAHAEPRNPDAFYYLGAAYAAQAMAGGRTRQALLASKVRSAFQRALELDPNHLNARWGLMHFYLLAPGLLGGNTDAARQQAAELRKRNPYRGAMAWGTIHANEKYTAAAEREFQQAMQIAPDSMPPISALSALYRKTGRPEKAFALLERMQRERPGEMRVHFLIGRTARESGTRLEQGEQSLRRYLDSKPGEGEPSLARAHLELGGIYARRGDRDAARQQYQAALQLEPGLGEAREALRKLGS